MLQNGHRLLYRLYCEDLLVLKRHLDASFAASMFARIVDCVLLATEANLTKFVTGNFLIQHFIGVQSDPLLAY